MSEPNRNESVHGGPTGTCPGETTALLGEVSQRRAQVQHRIRITDKDGAQLYDGALLGVNVYIYESR
jgi:hypothetical protein